MNLDLWFALVFYGLVYIFFLRNRDKFEIQGKVFALYKTKLGLKFMDRIAKSFPRALKVVSYVSIAVAFLGMIVMFGFLFYGVFNLVFKPAAPPILAPVLPGIKIAGAPPLSFWHWIIAIFIAAAVHEFSHGVFARLYNVKVKSSGFAFLGPILAAFVEPDEKILAKKEAHQKLAIFSAGPFSNIVLGLLLGLFALFILPFFIQAAVEFDGVQILEVSPDSPVALAGISNSEIILAINNVEMKSIDSFKEVLKDIGAGEKFNFETNTSSYLLTATPHPEDERKGFLGVSVSSHFMVKSKLLNLYPGNPLALIGWMLVLIQWLITINLGIALFNLLPLGPVDGGRMFYSVSLLFFQTEEKAKKVWSYVSFCCLLLIIMNLLPWLHKLLLFIAKGISSFISVVA